MAALTWMKQSSLTDLHANVKNNLDRYRNGGFNDMVDTGWCQKDIVTYQDGVLDTLSGSSKSDMQDSVLLYEALCKVPVRLTTYMNLWVPLIHTNMLSYTRKRWLRIDGSDDELVADINTHIFKGGITGYRDDNSAARLWWHGYIGSRIAGSNRQEDIEPILKPFMRTTDTRQAVFERPGIFSECGLAKNISEYVAQGRLQNSDNEKVFRDFVKNINLRSNGRYFGDMSKSEVFDFLDTCA